MSSLQQVSSISKLLGSGNHQKSEVYVHHGLHSHGKKPHLRGGFVVVHRHTDDSVGVYNLLITAVRALCFAANIFIDSCVICFGDYLDSYPAFATPCSSSLNHKSGLIKRKPNASCAFLSRYCRRGGWFFVCFAVASFRPP